MVFIKRFVSLLLAFALAVGLAADCAPRGKAVVPQLGLAAVGLAAFVVSSGFSMLWEDKEHNTEMLISDLEDLWSEFQAEATGIPLLDQFPDDSVALDGSKIILSRDAAQNYQGFVNWLAAKYDWKPGQPQTIIQSQAAAGSIVSGSARVSYPFNFSPSSRDGWIDRGTAFGSRIVTSIDTAMASGFVNNYTGFVIAASSAPFIFGSSQHVNNDDLVMNKSPDTYTYDNKTVYYCYSSGTYNGYSLASNVPLNSYSGRLPLYESLAWEMIYGNVAVSGGGGLLASVADAILNRVSHMLPTDTMALDVGYVAAEQEDEQDIIAGIADAIIAGFEGVMPLDVNATIVGAEGTEVLYPTEYVTDVDSLGLPDLGAALVRRFPFSIPWDFAECFKTLSAPAKDPVFTVDLFPTAFKSKIGITADTSFTIDGTDPKFSTLVLIVRWSALVTFYLALAFGTKRLIWTTGG